MHRCRMLIGGVRVKSSGDHFPVYDPPPKMSSPKSRKPTQATSTERCRLLKPPSIPAHGRRHQRKNGAAQPLRMTLDHAGGQLLAHRIDALRRQFRQLVIDLACLPCIDHAAAQPTHQIIAVFGGPPQYRAAVGTALTLVELHRHRLGETIREQRALCRGILCHVKAVCAA